MSFGAKSEAGRSNDEHVLVRLGAETAADDGLVDDVGGLPSAIDSLMRRTVSSLTTRGSPSGDPTPKPALLTNNVAVRPSSITAMLPQGMLIKSPAIVPATLPLASSTMRQPAPLVPVVPSALGALPTMTQPDLSMVIAVVRPTPPGHCARSRGNAAKVVSFLVVGL